MLSYERAWHAWGLEVQREGLGLVVCAGRGGGSKRGNRGKLRLGRDLLMEWEMESHTCRQMGLWDQRHLAGWGGETELVTERVVR